jgi:hypothetical protein
VFVLIMFVRDTSDRQTVTHKRGLSVYCKLMSRLHTVNRKPTASLSPGPEARQPDSLTRHPDPAPTRHRPGTAPATRQYPAVPGNSAARHRPSAA